MPSMVCSRSISGFLGFTEPAIWNFGVVEIDNTELWVWRFHRTRHRCDGSRKLFQQSEGFSYDLNGSSLPLISEMEIISISFSMAFEWINNPCARVIFLRIQSVYFSVNVHAIVAQKFKSTDCWRNDPLNVTDSGLASNHFKTTYYL